MDSDLWKKAEELFIRCADMVAADKIRFIDRECAGDDALRAIVAELLRGDMRTDQIGDVVERTVDGLISDRRDTWIGEQVGAYTITSRIAVGGMGVVYCANRSDRQFKQEVAIKLLTSAIITPELRSRFLAERQILADLNHINIAKLLDGGETDRGVPYLVMEYIDGLPIDEYCAAQRPTIDDRIRMFTQICSAVHFAHGHLIVHRDIKPSNILVTADGVPKLLDFGIAKLLDERNLPAGAALTVDGSRLLTPRYASPEQIRAERTTTASDIYSLGLLLYELLCGQLPYGIGRTSSPGEIEKSISTENLSSPSARIDATADVICLERRTSSSRLRKKLRGDLDTIVLKALRIEPELRYSSARDFAEDLHRVADNRPIMARPPTLPYVASRYWTRHRTAAIGLVATVSAIIVGVAFSTIGFFQAREAERIAVEEAQRSQAISDFLVGLFRAADPNEHAGNELSVSAVLELSIARIETEMESTPIVKASILETLSSVYKARSDYDKSAVLLEHALQLHEAHALDDPTGRARLSNDLGDLYRILERYSEATLLMESAYAIYNVLNDSSSMGRADAVNNLALLYGVTDRSDDSGRMFLEARRLREALYDPPHADIALSLHNLAWHFRETTNFTEAERYAKEALAMRIDLFGSVHPRVATTTGLLSDIYFKQANWVDAERTARKSLDIVEQVYETGNREITRQIYEVARVMHVRGDLRGANEYFLRAISLNRNTYGPGHWRVGRALAAHAENSFDLGHYDEAESALHEARDVFLNLDDEYAAVMFVNVESLLGHSLLRRGNLEDSSRLLANPVDLENKLAYVRRATFTRQLVRARLLLKQDDVVAAGQQVDSLLHELSQSPGHHLPLLPQVLQVHGQVQLASGHIDAAIVTFNEALNSYAKSWDDDYWRAALVKTDLGAAYFQNGDPDHGRSHLKIAIASLIRNLGTEHPDTRRAAALLDTHQ